MGCCWSCVLYLIIGIVLYKVVWFLLGKLKVNNISGKAVLITGCDTGFGRMTTLRLEKRGMKVFAACLTEEGVNSLKNECSSRVIPFLMDVTKLDSIKTALDQIKEEFPSEGLWALINNAGVLRSGNIHMGDLRDWQLMLNVNVMGIANTTSVFIPYIQKAKGRIINIASVAGRLATPETCGYNASKFAVEGLSDSWRLELKQWGVDVIIIEPGIMKTPLWDVPTQFDALKRRFEALPKDIQEMYGFSFIEEGHKQGVELVNKLGGDPVQVVDGLEHATLTRFPARRYAIGKDTPLWIGLSYLPSCLSDFLLGKVVFKGSPVPQALKK